MTTTGTSGTEQFRTARDFLLRHREDYAAAYEGFAWPRPERFNWALDWFDVIARDNDRTALHIVEEDGPATRFSFAHLSARSNQVANWLRDRGVRAGDRVVVMLGNQVELWEIALAAMKLRAVVIPATPLLGPVDLRDRIRRGRARHVVVRSEDTAKFDDVPGDYTHRRGRRPARLDLVRRWGRGQRNRIRLRGLPRLRARRRHPRRRPPDALLHLGHDGPPEAGRAHPCRTP